MSYPAPNTQRDLQILSEYIGGRTHKSIAQDIGVSGSRIAEIVERRKRTLYWYAVKVGEKDIKTQKWEHKMRPENVDYWQGLITRCKAWFKEAEEEAAAQPKKEVVRLTPEEILQAEQAKLVKRIRWLRLALSGRSIKLIAQDEQVSYGVIHYGIMRVMSEFPWRKNAFHDTVWHIKMYPKRITALLDGFVSDNIPHHLLKETHAEPAEEHGA